MTMAQIELLTVDKPVTFYGKKNEFSVPSTEELEECRKKYEKEYAENGMFVDPKKLMANFK